MIYHRSTCFFVILILSQIALAGCAGGTEDETAGPLDDESLGVSSQQVSFGGHDYLFVVTPKSWHEAQIFCAQYQEQAGYHLVVVNDANEESFLHSSQTRFGSRFWWIGYSDEGIEGTWLWSGDASNFSNWGPGQPDNNRNQDCAIDHYNNGDAWNDGPCSMLNSFVCELDASPVGNRGTFSYSASGTNNATVNVTQRAVSLFAGQLFTMGTCGLPGASGSRDTYLRLRNPSGGEIAANDDTFGCGVLSNISVVVPVNGTYTMVAGCFSTGACSGVVAYSH